MVKIKFVLWTFGRLHEKAPEQWYSKQRESIILGMVVSCIFTEKELHINLMHNRIEITPHKDEILNFFLNKLNSVLIVAPIFTRNKSKKNKKTF